MTAAISNIIDKYQGVASSQIIHAVEAAAAKTGADFSYLMEKASAESGFDPAARSKSSTATGLFQFIESTWLSMVKEHGAKYGLGGFADRIQIRDGKACVEDCQLRKAILNLRKNPEIAALMAGEYSAGNRHYLEGRVRGNVGTTELYLAHFLGAGGAVKFLNSRAADGDAIASHLFPGEALANKNVFFEPATGQARTLNDIYDLFAQKFDGGTAAPPSLPLPPPARQQAPSALSLALAQALLSFQETESSGDGEAARSGFSRAGRISADNVLMLARMRAV